MATITAWGGIDEIGGNKFLLREGHTAVFLDFGLSYDREGRLFELPFLQPGCLADLTKTGILPLLDGCYKNFGITPDYSSPEHPQAVGSEEPRAIDALFLSHGHVDHHGYAGLLRPDIPIHASPATCRLLLLRSEISETFASDLAPASFTGLGCSSVDGVQIGDLHARAFPVDHSVPGATGWIIDTGSVRIGYTGDLRLHGGEQGRQSTLAYMQALAEHPVDYLLCEGTRLRRPLDTSDEETVETHGLPSEEAVRERVAEIIAGEPRLVVYDGSPADVGRMRLVCEIAASSGRKVAIDAKAAFLLLYLNSAGPLMEDLPSVEDIHIILGRRKLGSNCRAFKDIGIDDLYVESYTQARQGHERILLSQVVGPPTNCPLTPDEIVPVPADRFIWGPGRREILDNPSDWLIYTCNGPLTCLHFLTQPGEMEGTYIYGKAEPFNEEMEFTFHRLLEWLKMAGLKLHYAHTSGHIRKDDLEFFVRESGAKCVIPIHTESAQMFEEFCPATRPIVPGVEEVL